jgi:hypothetical protein
LAAPLAPLLAAPLDHLAIERSRDDIGDLDFLFSVATSAGS